MIGHTVVERLGERARRDVDHYTGDGIGMTHVDRIPKATDIEVGGLRKMHCGRTIS